jgi:predicted DNA binding protein
MAYVAVPRRVTAGDVADELGISKSAFLERFHCGEHHVFSKIFG